MKIKDLKDNVQGMRDKILDLAMRGKLVSQDENDEPASVLLEKIAQEKEQLIKEKKLKKTKPLPEITDEEKPFDIPDSWKWVRLGDISNIFAGGDKPSDYSAVKDEQHPFEIFSNGVANAGLYGFTKNARVYEKSLTISARGTIGHVEVRKNPFLPIIRLITVTPYISDTVNFLGYYLTRFAVKSEGSSIPQLTVPKLKPKTLPLPPLNEQKRIAAKVEELFALIDTIEESLTKYEDLQEELEAKVLDLAMQGKLVEQRDDEEPAGALLEKIKAEKAELIKEKKIKKTKPLPEITDEEKPFAIPESWEWVRFGNMVNFYLGKTPRRANSEYWENGQYPWVSISDMNNQEHLTKTKERITKKALKDIFNNQLVPKNTLLMSFKLTIGKTVILDEPAVHNEAIISIFPIINEDNVTRNYLYYLLHSVSNMGYATPAIKGKTLNKNLLNNLKIPLPPLKEQRRIVDKVVQLFDYFIK